MAIPPISPVGAGLNAASMGLGPAGISATTPDWAIPGIGSPEAAQAAAPQHGFASMLADQVGQVQDLQTQAAQSAQALATGQTSDASSVVMDIERARLGMQLAAQVRNKLVEAYSTIWQTQV